jgi:hypothetical protein
VEDENVLIFVSCSCRGGRTEWPVMSRVGVLVVAVVMATMGFVVGWLVLASAAEPELREPVVVHVPSTGGTSPPQTTGSTGPPTAPRRPSVVPPPTVGPTGQPEADDDGGAGADDSGDDDTGGGDGGADVDD